MQNILTYNSSFLDDSFAIFKNENLIGKLFKGSWFGWTVDIKCNGMDYRIERKGIFKPTTIITDRKQDKVITKLIVIPTIFGLYSKAKANFTDGREFQWKQNGIINRSWEWTENGIVVIRATEDNKLFSLKGKINLTDTHNDNELLGLLGLYLRSSITNQSIISFWLAITILVFQMLRWIYG
jgi:hypothetical protein